MSKVYVIGGGVVLAAVTAVIALAMFSGGSSASTIAGADTASSPPVVASPAPVASGTLAIAIGQLTEDDGETATVDLRATNKDGAIGGAFRFFSDEYGYYNGGVKTFRLQDGVITVTGGGGLFPPGGGRVQVQYKAVFGTSNNHAEITVKPRNGAAYTMEGTIDGEVWAGSAASQP